MEERKCFYTKPIIPKLYDTLKFNNCFYYWSRISIKVYTRKTLLKEVWYREGISYNYIFWVYSIVYLCQRVTDQLLLSNNKRDTYGFTNMTIQYNTTPCYSTWISKAIYRYSEIFSLSNSRSFFSQQVTALWGVFRIDNPCNEYDESQWNTKQTSYLCFFAL